VDKRAVVPGPRIKTSGFKNKLFVPGNFVGAKLRHPTHARMMELADMPHSKCGAVRRTGSSPVSGT
jgi:hypothetical protein